MIPAPKLPLSLQQFSLFLSPKIASLQKRAKHSKKSEFDAADSTSRAHQTQPCDNMTTSNESNLMTWSRTTNGSTPPHVSKRVKAKSSPTPAAHLAHQTPAPPPPTAVLCWFRRPRHEAGGTICCAFSGNGCSIEPELCFCFVFFTSTDSSDVSVQIRREDAAESAMATPHGQTASEPYVQVTI